jgi:hypothetical protein
MFSFGDYVTSFYKKLEDNLRNSLDLKGLKSIKEFSLIMYMSDGVGK